MKKRKRIENYDHVYSVERAKAERYKASGKYKTDESRRKKREYRKKWIDSMPPEKLEELKKKISEYTWKWGKDNPEKRRSYVKKHKEKKKNSPLYITQESIRKTIGRSISKLNGVKSKRSEEILGCTWEQFVIHIEKQFTDGMNWSNRCDWEIDHIIPKHTAKTIDDVYALNHYTNLRPLWRSQNRKKSGKTIYLI